MLTRTAPHRVCFAARSNRTHESLSRRSLAQVHTLSVLLPEIQAQRTFVPIASLHTTSQLNGPSVFRRRDGRSGSEVCVLSPSIFLEARNATRLNSIRLNAARETLYAKLYTRNAIRETLYAKLCTAKLYTWNYIYG